MDILSKGHIWPDLTHLKIFGKVLSIQVFWLYRDQFHIDIKSNIWEQNAPRTEPRYTHTSTYTLISCSRSQVVEGRNSMTPGEHLKHPGEKVAFASYQCIQIIISFFS